MSTSISIETADEVALSAMLHHHAELRTDLDTLVRALRDVVATSTPYAEPHAAVVQFAERSILPHAAAEEQALYPAAAKEARLELLVDAMVLEHRELERRVASLAAAGTGVAALGSAEAIAAVFGVHVAKENELLLPALMKTPGVTLATLLRAMEDRLAQLLAARHEPHEHRQDPVTPPVEELDVRTLAHGSRHEMIFARLDALAGGGRLVIVNDHDPKPLHYQLDAAWPDTFEWDYLQSGPQMWRIAITKRV